MKNFIFGASGHAYVLASVLDVDVTFVVSSNAGAGQMLEYDFFHRIEDFRRSNIYIGIGNNSVRKAIYCKLSSFDMKVSNCISKNSFISRDAQLGQGVAILHGSVVGARAVIADNTIVNTLSSVDHDCVLGIHSQVTAGVTFGGTVKTGSGCFFGLKTGIIPNIVIGDNVVVMAGSLVTKNAPDNVLIGGSPAQIIRRIDAA